MEEHIGKKTADTILQKYFKVKAGGKNFKVETVSAGTLIEASGLISLLPNDADVNADNYILEILRVAKDSEVIGEILTTFIVGSRKHESKLHRLKKKYVLNHILYHTSPSEFPRILNEIFTKSDVAGFLSSICFLNEVNLLKTTKEKAEAQKKKTQMQMTPSGQQ